MDEKKQEIRAAVPEKTIYQLVEALTPDGRRVWQLQLTTPSEVLADDLMAVINEYLIK